MQTRLEPLNLKREREDYPQVNYVDKKGVQWIELNRGCKRQCEFCHADPNYKVFDVPEIVSNKVQIIGEGILYDPDIWNKFMELKNIKFNNKVIYYGLSQGVNYDMLNRELVNTMLSARIGLITNKGHWKKGIRIAWDWGKKQEKGVKKTIDMLTEAGYKRNAIIVFVLVNWKIPLKICEYKRGKLEEWKVMIDDCTFDCTKTNFIPIHWTYEEYKSFRKKCRDHNIEVSRGGYNPEKEVSSHSSPK